MSATTDDIDITAEGRNGKFARSKVSQRLHQQNRAAVITRWLRKIHLHVELCSRARLTLIYTGFGKHFVL
jgi:hypothetical protein